MKYTNRVQVVAKDKIRYENVYWIPGETYMVQERHLDLLAKHCTVTTQSPKTRTTDRVLTEDVVVADKKEQSDKKKQNKKK